MKKFNVAGASFRTEKIDFVLEMVHFSKRRFFNDY